MNEKDIQTRRKANTNLGKLIDKTHPADLALLFRFFNEIEQDKLFSIMQPGEHTGEFLGELDESIIKRLVENETAEYKKITEKKQKRQIEHIVYTWGQVLFLPQKYIYLCKHIHIY